ncbi:type VI secretion system accessory protein TagJ [Methylomicrobium sp. RS1]|jgi:type VI secretion system protein ImpE|uniref:type VI secretion system accessory protein TagJ n=1 Tax=Candidatus Methylomicrobium oryzae TaxID=2802053 RepID=UPI0019240C38|nr:type VI secretion system accessory protein TagJ [Methylomicrobium sp. RS1]MBL1265354.1 virulence protein SciE type [Methylomicrobium sp. RS1]
MTAEEYLKQGDLKSALLRLQDQVRANPAKSDYRVFLFQLLSVLGQWERALTQLNVAGELDDATLAMVSMYRQVIACERLREEVFSGRQMPVIFGQPSEWTALLVQALKLTAEGRYGNSRELRERAFALAPAVSGTIDGTGFAWLADSDSRLGPVFEAIIDGRYFWVPTERIASVVIEKPADLRDVVWLPAHFTWSNGGERYGVIPARYPASYRHDDPLFALSRKTAWDECGEDVFLGIGQKILTTDVAEYPLLDVREIHFNAGVDRETERAGG